MARLFNNIEFGGEMSVSQRLFNVIKPIKIKIGNPWFQEIEPTSFFSEEDLERSVLLNLQSLFPDFFAVTFKKKLTNTITGLSNTPDLALIKKDYSEWYIIEVELSSHNIKHIEQQISTFYNTNFKQEDVNYLIKKNKGLFNPTQLENLILSESPKLLIILNSHNDEIVDMGNHFNCAVCIFQMYLDRDGNPFYRLDGDYPIVKTDFCFCTLEKHLPFTMCLNDIHFINAHNLKTDNILNISYNNIITKWEISILKTSVYLLCKSNRFPLEPSTKRYQLSYNSSLKTFTFTKA